MSTWKQLQWLYLLNATVLITHQVDAAYWHEWQLFGIPGGIQLFLLFTLVTVIVILLGQQTIGRQQRKGIFFSWLLIASGLVAFVAHSYFLLQGDEAFTLPFSLALLVATLLLSLAQGIVTLRVRRE